MPRCPFGLLQAQRAALCQPRSRRRLAAAGLGSDAKDHPQPQRGELGNGIVRGRALRLGLARPLGAFTNLRNHYPGLRRLRPPSPRADIGCPVGAKKGGIASSGPRKNFRNSGCRGLVSANRFLYNCSNCGGAALFAREGAIFSNSVVRALYVPLMGRVSPAHLFEKGLSNLKDSHPDGVGGA